MVERERSDGRAKEEVGQSPACLSHLSPLFCRERILCTSDSKHLHHCIDIVKIVKQQISR